MCLLHAWSWTLSSDTQCTAGLGVPIRGCVLQSSPRAASFRPPALYLPVNRGRSQRAQRREPRLRGARVQQRVHLRYRACAPLRRRAAAALATCARRRRRLLPPRCAVAPCGGAPRGEATAALRNPLARSAARRATPSLPLAAAAKAAASAAPLLLMHGAAVGAAGASIRSSVASTSPCVTGVDLYANDSASLEQRLARQARQKRRKVRHGRA
jgi:hypothetical protein